MDKLLDTAVLSYGDGSGPGAAELRAELQPHNQLDNLAFLIPDPRTPRVSLGRDPSSGVPVLFTERIASLRAHCAKPRPFVSLLPSPVLAGFRAGPVVGSSHRFEFNPAPELSALPAPLIPFGDHVVVVHYEGPDRWLGEGHGNVVETSAPPAWTEPLLNVTPVRVTPEQAVDLARATHRAPGGPNLALLPPIGTPATRGYFAASNAAVRRTLARALGFTRERFATLPAALALWALCDRPFVTHLLTSGGSAKLHFAGTEPTRPRLALWGAESALARAALALPPEGSLIGRVLRRVLADLPGHPERVAADTAREWGSSSTAPAPGGPRPVRGSWDRLRHFLGALPEASLRRRFDEIALKPFAPVAGECPHHAAAELAFLGTFACCPWWSSRAPDSDSSVWADVIRDVLLPLADGECPDAAKVLTQSGGLRLPAELAVPGNEHVVLHPPRHTDRDRLRLALLAPFGSVVRVGGPATLEGYPLDGFSYLQEDRT